ATLLDDLPRASELVTRLATEPADGPHALHAAVQALIEAQHASDVERVLEAALMRPEANSEVAREWVTLRLERGETVWDSRLLELFEKNQQAGERATYAY